MKFNIILIILGLFIFSFKVSANEACVPLGIATGIGAGISAIICTLTCVVKKRYVKYSHNNDTNAQTAQLIAHDAQYCKYYKPIDYLLHCAILSWTVPGGIGIATLIICLFNDI